MLLHEKIVDHVLLDIIYLLVEILLLPKANANHVPLERFILAEILLPPERVRVEHRLGFLVILIITLKRGPPQVPISQVFMSFSKQPTQLKLVPMQVHDRLSIAMNRSRSALTPELMTRLFSLLNNPGLARPLAPQPCSLFRSRYHRHKSLQIGPT